eukprot:TRINITY_DN11753_c0_g1_i1.p2 TRINITY_DN11753_c0_g1~~TRINITY_DN11753_c0_g1_i1.p2  ORF type:complete len:108 (+),score=25.00 TRINITY_DN11753_c0_g1_i1:215-538(+)
MMQRGGDGGNGGGKGGSRRSHDTEVAGSSPTLRQFKEGRYEDVVGGFERKRASDRGVGGVVGSGGGQGKRGRRFDAPSQADRKQMRVRRAKQKMQGGQRGSMDGERE